MKHAWMAAFALLLLACGTGSHSPAGDASSAPETCGGYGPNDACMNEDNFAQCLEREAECPGEVLVLESCPLQFACP